MNNIIIENGFFARKADLNNPIDRALLEKASPEQTIIEETLDSAAEARTRLYMEEMAKTSYIISRPNAFDTALFNRYTALSSTLFVITRWGKIRPVGPITDSLMPMVMELRDLRERLVPLQDPEEGLWYIWGQNMPHGSVAQKSDWRMSFDTPDFRPFLIPYMLKDQSAVKGNIVVISGGGYEWRSNRWEGYEAVHRFNELGYNSFLLQRRVSPYVSIDGAMDLQRCIRYLRYHSEETELR